ncbi:cytochrome P450 monooxygenase [Phaeosphaeriaceae sp. PMI808]|nr:cytochrome P450 monooxygenase [Phaeosphaeriaceae sp. PMI808]
MLSIWATSLSNRDAWISDIVARPLPYALVVAVLAATVYICRSQSPYPKSLPLFNPPALFSSIGAKKRFSAAPHKLLAEARAVCRDQPFRIVTDVDEFVVLPPQFGEEIRNRNEVSFSTSIAKVSSQHHHSRLRSKIIVLQDFHSHLVPFRALSIPRTQDELLQSVVRKDLTRSLGDITLPLSNETSFALHIVYGEEHEWHEVLVNDNTVALVARLSSRVFLGPELCRNENWLRVTSDYTVFAFMGIVNLHPYPKLLRYILQWFEPNCKKILQLHNIGAREITPVIQARRDLRKAAAAAGKPVPVFNDALDWQEKNTGSSVDAVDFQLFLSFAAIHTTSSLLTQTMLEIARHPDIFGLLRQEIVAALGTEGWKKTSLYSLKLLDSVLKETQRYSLRDALQMRRTVTKDFRLSNGLLLRKGARLIVDTSQMVSSEIYDNPDQWIGDRFLKLRSQPGKENSSQLVSTSINHLGFGHGQHACPGRFFASNELKIALCHLLMKYDWKIAPGTDPSSIASGVLTVINPKAKILIRRRKAMEIDIDYLPS